MMAAGSSGPIPVSGGRGTASRMWCPSPGTPGAPSPEQTLADKKPLHLENLTTIVSVAILVGTELVGVSWAAGWAIGGLFQLPPVVSIAVEVIGVCLGLLGLYYFVRAALKVEPIRG